MKKTILSVSIITLISISSMAQTGKLIGAGVLDFLTTNSKTSANMSNDEIVALDLLSDLLKISSHREHETNIAKAGKSEIILNTGSSAANLVRGINGEVYILMNGVVYPVAKTLVQQASNGTYFNNSITMLQEYDINKLEISYLKPLNYTSISKNIKVKKKITTYEFNQILMREGFIITKQRFWWDHFPAERNMILNKGSVVTANLLEEGRINSLFTCNWFGDSRGDGFGIDDYHNVKRNFKKDEKVSVGMSYIIRTDIKNAYLESKVVNSKTGTVIFEENSTKENGTGTVLARQNIFMEKAIPGEYTMFMKLIANNNIVSSYEESFLVLPDNSSSISNGSNTKVEKHSGYKSKYNKLKEIKELLDNGILTQKEFDKEKNIILNEE